MLNVVVDASLADGDGIHLRRTYMSDRLSFSKQGRDGLIHQIELSTMDLNAFTAVRSTLIGQFLSGFEVIVVSFMDTTTSLTTAVTNIRWDISLVTCGRDVFPAEIFTVHGGTVSAKIPTYRPSAELSLKTGNSIFAVIIEGIMSWHGCPVVADFSGDRNWMPAKSLSDLFKSLTVDQAQFDL